MSKGWVKIHREISSHWVWDCEFSTGQAWVDLLMSACHKPNKIQIKGQMIELEKGQLARSEVTLSRDWKWSRNKVRRFLKNLENDGMIEQQKGNLTSVITICNYSIFQVADTANETDNETPSGTAGETTKGHLTEHLTEHKQEVNNLNKEKKVKENKPKKTSVKLSLDDARIVEAWNSLGCVRHISITKQARVEIEKTYKEYCKLTDSPAEPTDWLISYIKSGFGRWMTDHHKQLNDGQWAADLAFAVRPSTYDKVKSTVVTTRTESGTKNSYNEPELTKEEREAINRRELQELMEDFK